MAAWRPWHGCHKCSPGCLNCYVYRGDARYGRDASHVYRTGEFDLPVRGRRDGTPRLSPGETVYTCLTSDFFLEEADEWRDEAWSVMRQRRDVIFYLLTKRPERVSSCLPYDWGDGWDHIFFNVTCENQRRADERIPILFELPFKHKGIMAAPLIGPVDIGKYLPAGHIEQVMCGGENYDGSRPCHYEWVKLLSEQCREYDVTFNFIETGTYFVKNEKVYHIPGKKVQSQQAFRSGLSCQGRKIRFHLTDEWGYEIPEEALYTPHYHPVTCRECASRMTCNGCSDCGKCT